MSHHIYWTNFSGVAVIYWLLLLAAISGQITSTNDKKHNHHEERASGKCLEPEILSTSSGRSVSAQSQPQSSHSPTKGSETCDTHRAPKLDKSSEAAAEGPNLDQFSCSDSGKDSTQNAITMAANLAALEFEVFGKVQGVFFRKYTVTKGKELGLRGWCQNTLQGTVIGEVEGPAPKVTQMKEWLAKVGSPKSQITKADFRNERKIEKHKYSGFDVRK